MINRLIDWLVFVALQVCRCPVLTQKFWITTRFKRYGIHCSSMRRNHLRDRKEGNICPMRNTLRFAARCQLKSRCADWLIDWLLDRSIDWYIDWLYDCMIDWLYDCMIVSAWTFDVSFSNSLMSFAFLFSSATLRFINSFIPIPFCRHIFVQPCFSRWSAMTILAGRTWYASPTYSTLSCGKYGSRERD